MTSYRRLEVPIFQNLVADCMRAAMLSVIHYYDRSSPVTLEDLRRSASYYPGGGTDIALAAVTFNRLGLRASIFAGTYERVENASLDLAKQNGVSIHEGVMWLSSLARRAGSDGMVICAADPAHMYAKAISSSHAVVMTELPSRPALNASTTVRFHETIWRDEKMTQGRPNHRLSALCFEAARRAHDEHSVIIHPGPDFPARSRAFVNELRNDPKSPLRLQRQEAFDLGPARPVNGGSGLERLVDNPAELRILEDIMGLTAPKRYRNAVPLPPAAP